MTGTITAASTLDREATPEYTLIVMATDRGEPPQRYKDSYVDFAEQFLSSVKVDELKC